MNSLFQSECDQLAEAVPPRSRLYRLEPIGVGTSMVECLSSFIHRLAEAHGLPTWVLVRRELAPHFQRKSILGSRGGCELLGKMGGAINGNNASALEAVQILESLTGHANLSGLTLGKLRTLVARRNILRNCQAWCPSCLDEWHQNEKSIYQPLSWLLSDLTFCPQHLCLLEDSCFECKRSHSPLGRYRWDGKCPKCSTWLGRKQSAVSAEATKPISQWDEFATASIPHFILGIQELPKAALPVFPSNLTTLINKKFDGNTAALARIFRATRRTVKDWSDGTLRPSLSTLLMLEKCFGVKAMDWIIGAVPISELQTPPPMEKIAIDQIRKVPRKHDPEVVRTGLMQVLEANEYPTPSLRAICLRLGFQQTIATRMYPDLAHQIMANFKMFRTEKRRVREIFMKQAVESAVSQLLHEGRSLSFHQLAKVLPPHISIRDKRVLQEFRRLRAEAEQEMQAVMQEPAPL